MEKSKIEGLKKHLKMLEESEDSDFRLLIEEEIDALLREIIPQDKEDQSNAILEIRAGTGGEEAELFASELSRMYLKACEKYGFNEWWLKRDKYTASYRLDDSVSLHRHYFFDDQGQFNGGGFFNKSRQELSLIKMLKLLQKSKQIEM